MVPSAGSTCAKVRERAIAWLCFSATASSAASRVSRGSPRAARSEAIASSTKVNPSRAFGAGGGASGGSVPAKIRFRANTCGPPAPPPRSTRPGGRLTPRHAGERRRIGRLEASEERQVRSAGLRASLAHRLPVAPRSPGQIGVQRDLRAGTRGYDRLAQRGIERRLGGHGGLRCADEQGEEGSRGQGHARKLNRTRAPLIFFAAVPHGGGRTSGLECAPLAKGGDVMKDAKRRSGMDIAFAALRA